MSAQRRAARSERGQTLLELTLVFGVLLLLLCGVIDIGRAVLTRQSLAWVSREAANMAARGTPLPETLRAATVSGASLGLSSNGYVIVSKVSRDDRGVATVTAQQTGGGRAVSSMIGDHVGATADMPSGGYGQFPPRGQSVFVAEISCGFRPITPLGALLGSVFPTELRDVAYF